MSTNPYLTFKDADRLSAENVAARLIERGQDEDQWNASVMPVSPFGSIKNEVMRELATFVIPLSIIGVYYLIAGVSSLWITVPAALIVGFVLDKMLCDDVKKTIEKRLESEDHGRFEGQLLIAHKLNVHPSEVTLNVVRQLNSAEGSNRQAAQVAQATEQAEREHFLANVDRIIALQNAYSARGETWPQEVKDFRRRHKALLATAHGARKPAARSFAAGSAASRADADGVIADIQEINPATGSPMIGGFDTRGNVFGSNQF
ncbi:hypothetical protein [Comamonas thiooxydans]|uniref:hypothetical protein n=1 Tax=Comamonas thiooxydans TaxID=363952 RepID=UPI000B40E025|nr:hypothetical protein [Comamonas thiooxydans]